MSAENPRRWVPRHWVRWLTAGVIVIAAFAVGGPYIYTHFIAAEAPVPFSLGTKAPSTQAAQPAASTAASSPASSTAAAPLPGTWTVTSGSQVGYRVNEVLFGQQNTAVGRTGAVSGHLTIAGGTATAGSFTAQVATVKSDQSQRDTQFRGRIMDTSTYPTATFTLTRPITLAPVPANGAAKAYTAHGDLTLRGQTRPVTFQLTAQRTGNTIRLSGSIPVVFATWNIPNPSFGPITTQNHGVLEFLLVLGRP